jgi:DNA polymerase-3 subunit epsilon
MFDFAEKSLYEIPVVVLDTETTGLYPGLGDRMVEIGAARFEPAGGNKWQIAGQVSRLVNPGRPMEPKASQVTGISDAELAAAPPFANIAEPFLELVDGALLVAHNARFDADFLALEYSIYSLAQRRDILLRNPWLCTLELAKRHFHFGRNSLENIARVLAVRSGRGHRALNDVYITAEVLKRMAHLLQQRRMETVGDLLHAQGGAIYATPPGPVGLPPLESALATGQRLLILYMGEEGESVRVITPHYPATHDGVSYLIAFCHLRQQQRTFRVDRIFSAELVP